jgi:hypothetical protein
MMASESFAKGVNRTRADVTEHNADCADGQPREAAPTVIVDTGFFVTDRSGPYGKVG